MVQLVFIYWTICFSTEWEAHKSAVFIILRNTNNFTILSPLFGTVLCCNRWNLYCLITVTTGPNETSCDLLQLYPMTFVMEPLLTLMSPVKTLVKASLTVLVTTIPMRLTKVRGVVSNTSGWFVSLDVLWLDSGTLGVETRSAIKKPIKSFTSFQPS